MKLPLRFLAVVVGCAVFGGCHRHDEAGHHHDHDEQEESGDHHSHGDDAKSFSGATHKEGTGITLLPQTKERLGVEVEEVRETALSREISFTARVFTTETNGQYEASGIVPATEAKFFDAGVPVTLVNAKQERLQGVIASSAHPVSTNETELVVRFPAGSGSVAPGSFLRITAAVPSEDVVMTVPREALITGPAESFVYVQNGEAYLRTVVQPGRRSSDSVEVKDGLLEGDSVVSRGAMDLWLIELRAVKGGQGCCPAPPAKGKGS